MIEAVPHFRTGRSLSVPVKSPHYILHMARTATDFPLMTMDIVRLEGHEDPLYAGGAAEMVGLHFTIIQ